LLQLTPFRVTAFVLFTNALDLVENLLTHLVVRSCENIIAQDLARVKDRQLFI